MKADKVPINKKPLGFWMLCALVTGNMIGGGIFILPANLARYGLLGLSGWIIAAIGSLFLAFVYARLCRKFPHAGGPYTYSHRAFGEVVGFQVAFCYWCATWIGNAATALAFNDYFVAFYPDLANDPSLRCGLSIAILWILTGIQSFGIRQAGVIQVFTTILKLLPLFIIPLFAIKLMHAENLQHVPHEGTAMSALSNSTLLAFWAFIGLESATVPSDKVERPEVLIPRATVVGVLIATLVYIAGSIVLLGVFGQAGLSESIAPYADASKLIFGKDVWVSVCACISVLGTLNGWILIQAKIPQVAAADGLFPKFFAKENRFGVPFIALLISTTMMSILIELSQQPGFTQQYEIVVRLASFCYLIPYFMSSLAEVVLSLQNGGEKRLPWTPMLRAVAAAFFAFWAMAGAGTDSVYYGALFFFASFLIYILLKVERYWLRRQNQ